MYFASRGMFLGAAEQAKTHSAAVESAWLPGLTHACCASTGFLLPELTGSDLQLSST